VAGGSYVHQATDGRRAVSDGSVQLDASSALDRQLIAQFKHFLLNAFLLLRRRYHVLSVPTTSDVSGVDSELGHTKRKVHPGPYGGADLRFLSPQQPVSATDLYINT